MQTIYKYQFDIPSTRDEFEIEMHDAAEILSVQMQHDQPCMWVMCNPKFEMSTRRFRLAGTGHQLHDNFCQLKYVGTFQDADGFVYHLFEILT